MITQCLNDIFEREHTHEPRPPQNRQQTRSSPVPARAAGNPSLRRGVYHALRLRGQRRSLSTMKCSRTCKDQEILDEETTLLDAQKFLEHHLKSDEVYEIFVCLARRPTPTARRKRPSHDRPSPYNHAAPGAAQRQPAAVHHRTLRPRRLPDQHRRTQRLSPHRRRKTLRGLLPRPGNQPLRRRQHHRLRPDRLRLRRRERQRERRRSKSAS